MNPRPPLLILDLEATCWPRERHDPGRMEIIEIGALLVCPDAAGPVSEFQSFVRPVDDPHLSRFCMELTTIRQEDVDAAPGFPTAISSFTDWIGDIKSVRLASWGSFDRRQLEQDCARHHLDYPFRNDHFNIKNFVSERMGRRPGGLQKVMRAAGLLFEGTPHRALDDARATMDVLRWSLGNDGLAAIDPA